MVGLAAPHGVPGLHLGAADLLALRLGPPGGHQRPVSRRPGALSGKPPGNGTDLREIRGFTDGDDARRIDPAATARTGQLHVRRFHEDRDDATVLIVDFRPLMIWGTQALRSVRAARRLVAMAWPGVLRGGTVGALIIGAAGVVPVPLAGGDSHMLSLIQTLVRQHRLALGQPADAPGDQLAEALARAAQMAPRGADVHWAGAIDGLPQNLGPAVSRLARGRNVTLHLLLDRVEVAPPAVTLTAGDGTFTRRGRLMPFDEAPLVAWLRASGAQVEKVGPDDA